MSPAFENHPNRVPFFEPDIGHEECDAVARVLSRGWLTSGPEVAAFEREFASFVSAPHAVATNSCTAALRIAMRASDIGPGSRVVMSPYNFVAAAEVSEQLGAELRFVDIDRATLNLDPAAVDRLLSTLPRARSTVIVAVHIAGLPCALDELDRVAARHDARIIEDAAHALPARYRGAMIGGMAIGGTGRRSRAVCFSFYANKTLTTGEGGMLTTDDADFAARCRRLALHGIDRSTWSRESSAGERPAWEYDVVESGDKANLSDVQAAIGRVQLTRADAGWRRRAEIAARYDAALAATPLELPHRSREADPSHHLYIVRTPRPEWRDRLHDALATAGIATSVHYRPLHLHTKFRVLMASAVGDYPIAEDAYQHALSLPIYPRMADAAVDRVTAVVRAALSTFD